ncbi:MAG TPA: hypothetical protein VID27_17220 [Blastocatellia bacterium]
MIRIKCVNSNCSSPDGKFDWDESPHDAGGGLSAPREPGAKRVIAICPYCSTQNAVWLKSVKKKDQLRRGRRR